jgi:hypothetical protein
VKYKVIKKAGKFQVGRIVDDSTLRVRRLIQEGDCLEKYRPEKKVEIKENKMEKQKYENKEAN